MEEVREHFRECMQHFLRRCHDKIPRYKRGRGEPLTPFAQFCGVATSTALSWCDHIHLDQGGLVKIKAMCYLDLHGYKVIELEQMAIARRGFTELIGFSLIDLNEAMRVLSCENQTTVFRIVFGKSSDDRHNEAMWETRKNYLSALEAKKRELKSTSALAILSEQPIVMDVATPQSAKAIQPKFTLVDSPVVTGMPHHIPPGIAAAFLQSARAISALVSEVGVVSISSGVQATGDDIEMIFSLASQLSEIGKALVGNKRN